VVDCCVVVRCLQWPLEDTITGKDGGGWLNPRSSGARRSGQSTQKRTEAALSLIGLEQARAGVGNIHVAGAGAAKQDRTVTIQSEGFLLRRKVSVRPNPNRRWIMDQSQGQQQSREKNP
jgi:hypothetical protein